MCGRERLLVEVVRDEHEIMCVFFNVTAPARIVAVVVNGENGGLPVWTPDRDGVALSPDTKIYGFVEKTACPVFMNTQPGPCVFVLEVME